MLGSQWALKLFLRPTDSCVKASLIKDAL